MKKKILIFGINSFLGKNVVNVLSKSFDIYGTYFNSKPYFNMKKKPKILKTDLTKRDFFNHNFFAKFKADIILNCAGESSVDICEKNKIMCKKKIVSITKNTSDFARRKKIYYVTISTDILFKNKKNKIFSEKDTPNTYNYYGKLKLFAEKYVKKTNNNSLIIRTRFFGLKSNNSFLSRLLKLKTSKKKIVCYDNIYSTPIYVNDLIKSIIFCFKKKIRGVFHIVGDNLISRYNFALLVFEIFKIDKNQLIAKTFNKNDMTKKNIYSSALSNKKIKKHINFKFKKIKTSIKEIRNNI